MAVKGRMTIRKPSGNPLIPSINPLAGPNPSAVNNRMLHLWEFDPKPGTALARLEQVYLASLDAVDNFAEYREASAKSNAQTKKFTESGLKDEIQNHALTRLTPVFRKGRTVVESAREEATALRKKLARQTGDRSDVVGAMMRAEIRSWLRAMPAQERDAYFTNNIERLDPAVALAVLEAPAALSGGVPQSIMTELHDRAVAAQHGEEAKQRHRIRIIHEPEDDNKAHTALRGWPRDNDPLLDLLAEDTWSETVLNKDVPV